MTALVFMVVCVLDRDGDRSKIEDLNGLCQRSPGLAFLLLVAVCLVLWRRALGRGKTGPVEKIASATEPDQGDVS